MMFKRLVIIGCCAIGGFGFGRFLSSHPGSSATERRLTDSEVAAPAAPVPLPPPERAGRVPFVEIYHSLRSSRTEERVAYLYSLQQLPDSPDRRAALTAFFQCLASLDPQQAADLVQRVGKDDRKPVVLAVLAATSTLHTPGLVKMLLDLPADVDPGWRERMLNSQMYFWAALDPTAAAQFADQYQSIYPDLAAHGVLQFLAAADPEAAERWLREHPDLRKQPEPMSDFIQGLFESDPANARRYLIDHAADEKVLPAVETTARLTFLNSADDAVEFINHLPTKDARQAALAGILDINTELFATNENNVAALSAGLAEWVTKFSPDDWPPGMFLFLAKWRGLDPAGSVNWMTKLPAPTRSAVAVEFVRNLSPREIKQVLDAATGDSHHDVLRAVAAKLSLAPMDVRKSMIAEFGLPPQEAAELMR